MSVTGARMYTMKPLQVGDGVFNYNTSMYPMKTLVLNSAAGESGSINNESELYSHVERSQQLIFDYIKDIKREIDELKRMLLKRSSDQGKSVSRKEMSQLNFNKSGLCHELVVNCDVDKPPNSILVLKHLNRDITLDVTSHNHSSLKSLPESLKNFENFKDKDAALKIRLVWKNGGGTSVTIGHVPLSGEVSLLRFIHSCLPNDLNLPAEIKLQEALDRLHNQGVSSLNSTSKFIVADKLTVVDLALWSALKGNKPPANLQNWFNNMDQLLTR